MNRKQLIVLWTIGLLLCIALVLSTYKVKYIDGPKPNTLDALLAPEEGEGAVGWHVNKVNRIDIVSVNVIRYASPILIIGFLLLYSLRHKNKT